MVSAPGTTPEPADKLAAAWQRECEEVSRLEAENARLRAALRPFAACVYNDNGDMAVSASRAAHSHFCDAYLAYHATEPRKAARG